MRRPLLFLLLGVVAAGAAVLAIGTPETVDLPAEASAPAAAPAPADDAAPAAAPEEVASIGPSPAAAAHEAEATARRERRQQPDARKAASFASAWNGIQYRLTGRSEPAAKDLAQKIEPLVKQLRDAYQHPEKADPSALYAQSDALKAELEASGLVDDSLRAQVDRLGRLAEAAAAPSPTSPSAEPEDEPPTPE